MAVSHKSTEEEKPQTSETSSPSKAGAKEGADLKRKKDPGVRVVGGRIFDSENGKTCHQCRQKTRDFTAQCKKLKKDKLCTIKYCHKCLLNRYGEKAEEAEAEEIWECPKCRGVCNCSFCMKKKGLRPTGILVHAAKATGYDSVHDLLSQNGDEFYKSLRGQETDEIQKGVDSQVAGECMKGGWLPGVCDAEVFPGAEKNTLKVFKSKVKKPQFTLNEPDKENVDMETFAVAGEGKPPLDVYIGGAQEQHISKKRKSSESHSEPRNDDFVLPQGTPILEVAGVEFGIHEVGAAFQFLEFCKTFAKVLDIRKGQPEAILRNIGTERTRRRASYSCTIEFQIKLLSFIEKDMEQDSMNMKMSWLQAVKSCIDTSECPFKELPPDLFSNDSSKYDSLDPCIKLKLLNFLCDETLGSSSLRSWIEQENMKFKETKKDVQDKEKILKQKLKDDLAKALLSRTEGAQLSVSEHDDIISTIKSNAEKAHAELLDYAGDAKKKRRPDAVRIEPLFLEGSGKVYWKLGSYFNASKILCQDIGKWGMHPNKDTWVFFDEENERVIEKHISSVRKRRLNSLKNILVDVSEVKKLKPEVSDFTTFQTQE